MSKRSKVGTSHTSLRLTPDVAGNLDTAAKLTGWSVARCVAHMVRLGFAAAAKSHARATELAAEYHGAMMVHRVELENARRLADARKSVKLKPAPPHPTKDAKHVATVQRLAAARAAKRRPADKLPPLPQATADSAA